MNREERIKTGCNFGVACFNVYISSRLKWGINMETFINKEQNRPVFNDRFSFLLFFFPELVFLQVENVQAIYQKTSDDALAYIRGSFEIWIGLRPKGCLDAKCYLKVIRRTFCFLLNFSDSIYPENAELDCRANAEIELSRLWNLNFLGKLPLVPWKAIVTVKVFFREPIEDIFDGFYNEEITKKSREKEAGKLPFFLEKTENLAYPETRGEEPGFATKKGEEKEDLIALDQLKQTSPFPKQRSPLFFTNAQKPRYQFYDLIMKQWESKEENNRK